MSHREIAVLSQAKALGMGNTLFKYLPAGAEFSFEQGGKILIKHRNGYHVEGVGYYRVGQRVAVWKGEKS